MPTTKPAAVIWDSQTLTAGAADTTSAVQMLPDGYGAGIGIKITNGATGPTVAAQCQVQVSQDNSEWYDFGGPLVAGTANSEVYSWVVDIPMTYKYVRLVAGSNTIEDVTIDADICEVTAI
jgi:hypothetical protein